MSLLHSVTTVTPLRVSFAGGGSDLPSFFEHSPGAVFNMAIRQYVQVTVKRHSPLFGEKYRLSYSQTETANKLSEIKNDIARASIEICAIDEPLHIITSADLPAQSGLGSSSSFAVGLLRALHELRGDSVSPGQLAEEACSVEIGALGKPIGKQDQYAAAFGGLSFFEFHPDGSVKIESLPIRENVRDVIESLFIVWTGVPRLAEQILENQNARSEVNFPQLEELVRQARELRDEVYHDRVTPEILGARISAGWIVKKGLSEEISTGAVEEIIGRLESHGALGQKVAGAGGGGFVLGVARNDAYQKILGEFGSERVLRPGYCATGSWTVGRVG